MDGSNQPEYESRENRVGKKNVWKFTVGKKKHESPHCGVQKKITSKKKGNPVMASGSSNSVASMSLPITATTVTVEVVSLPVIEVLSSTPLAGP